jgi:hypothetical protein
MSALRLTKLFGPVESFEKIEKRIRDGFLLDCAIQGFQFGSDPGVRVAGAGARSPCCPCYEYENRDRRSRHHEW